HISDFRYPRTISLAKRSRSIHAGQKQTSGEPNQMSTRHPKSGTSEAPTVMSPWVMNGPQRGLRRLPLFTQLRTFGGTARTFPVRWHSFSPSLTEAHFRAVIGHAEVTAPRPTSTTS